MISPGDTIEILVDRAECANVIAGDIFKVARVNEFHKRIEVEGEKPWWFSLCTEGIHWKKVEQECLSPKSK